MSQDERFDVLGGGRAAHQQDQSEHLLDQKGNRGDTATITPGLWE